jgi:hypothetical protein
MPQFETPAPITATLTVPAGRIQLIAADRTDTVVEIRPVNPGRNRDVQAASQTTVTFTGGALRVTAPAPRNKLLGPTGEVEVTVKLPAGSMVRAEAAATELRVVGRLGDLTFDGAYRQIKIDEATAVMLTAVDGDVEVGRLTGPADITTTRGSIRIAEAHRGRLTLTTSAGDITVTTAPGTSATLNAGTTQGRVANTLKNNGTPELEIHATTTQGDITAKPL